MENELKYFLLHDEFYQDGILTDVKAMVLTRKNLCKQYEEIPFKDVDWIHFKYRTKQERPSRLFMEIELCIFVDDDGKTKLLKNRWGNTGEVK